MNASMTQMLPVELNFGTWLSHGIANENKLIGIPKDIGLEAAALISYLPTISMHMLEVGQVKAGLMLV
jgi:hypothetical protein